MARRPIVAPEILAILATHHSLRVMDLVEELAKRKLPVNKTSVYRALEKLVEDGQICKQIFAQDDLVYELREHHHDHLVCERCGNVESIKCETRNVKKIRGFSINHHHTTFFGLCKKCKDKMG